MKSHLETRSVARHVAIANREAPMSRRPGALLGDGERFNSIGCGQGRTNGRQQDQRCERGNTHIIETRKQALRSSATVYREIG